MGHFNETICDCCVCPMQCALEQLVGQDIDAIIVPIENNFSSATLIEVKDFIAFTSVGEIPICQIAALNIGTSFTDIKLKPIKKSTGDCKCCEDPMTNLLNSMKGQFAQFESIGFSLSPPGRVLDVGEGITTVCFMGGFFSLASNCFLTRVIPSNQQQINNQSSFSGFGQFKKATPPLATKASTKEKLLP
ncbi:hypothetical protein VQL36_02860 [Chengkuizengella sp. SCS-71B]|uniref:hypothetical protein n=1 Tax=Chengkuizengella sp. SCS-71B TaxID=3115290 RepID=UPI0032C21943